MTRRGRHPTHCGGAALCLAAVALFGVPAAAQTPSFALPLDCTLGETCFIQNYVDTDPGDGFADFRCRPLGYDGHNGTDFRVLPGAKVPVIAMSAGRVLRVRDGAAERTLSGPSAAQAGRECGNGVVIDHGGGWETLSCHLAEGSIPVRPGDEVEAGDIIGTVGLSGMTEFRHVHARVMRDGETIDPFTGYRPGEAQCGAAGTPVWQDAVVAAAEDAGDTHILAAGFAAGPVAIEAIQDGTVAAPRPGADAMVGYGLAMAVEAGDEHVLTLDGPSLSVTDRTEQPRFQAQAMRFAGRRLADGAAPGIYRLRYQIVRSGQVVDEATVTLTLPAEAQ